MTEGHRAHLCASLSTLEDAIRDITAIAREGRSPTSGQRLTPLPAADWAVLETALQRAVTRLSEVVRMMAPDYLAERNRAEGLGGTLFRLALILRTVEEELIDGLHPRRMEARFGEMDDAERHVLDELVKALQADLGEVHEALERLRDRGS